MPCPPTGPRDQNILELTCLAQAQTLYNAYVALLSGKRAVDITYDNYTVRYRATMQGDLAMLRDLYMQTRNGCPEAAALPDISPGRRVRRGPAVFGTFSR